MDDTFKQALALTEQAVADQCDDKLKEVAGRETLNANYWKAKYEAEAAQSMLAGSQLSALRLQLKDAQSAVSATERSAIIEECAKECERGLEHNFNEAFKDGMRSCAVCIRALDSRKAVVEK